VHAEQNRKRPTIGLLVDLLEDRYQNTVLRGVADACAERDVNLICFAGGGLSSPERFGRQRNRIFDLVSGQCVDALLLMSGTLANYVGPAEMAKFCARFKPLPICSLAVAIEGIPSILVDNATGMRQAVVHLINTHHCQRIAFIRGPKESEEAEHRYQVYQDVLEEYGMPLRDELVVSGDFQKTAGVEAVRVFFDGQRQPPDAIVAADDYMALGVIEALQAKGMEVPGDVAVVGFDDVEEARFTEPPLTTVHQPLYEKGRFATETILAMLRGEAVADRLVMHTDLVTRLTCGCEKPISVAPGSGGEREVREQAQQRLHVERWAKTLSRTEQKLITNFDIVAMVNAVAEQLPQLGISSCYLSLYKDESLSELILAYDARYDTTPQTSGDMFESGVVVPKRWLPRDRRYSFVVEPLFFEDQQFGFAVFEIGPSEGIVYEMLRDQISAAIKGAALVREVLDKDAERKELLSYIIDVTPDMHRIQPLADLLQDVLRHAMGLANSTDAFLATPPEGEEGAVNLVVRATTGGFNECGHRLEECATEDEVRRITDALRQGKILVDDEAMIIPLRIRELSVGVVYLRCPMVSMEETELLRIFSNQATVAIQNTKLYEMAALDPLTGVHTRRFFEQWMQRQLRAVFRSRQPVSLLMIDVDGLKHINDTSGHLVGDQALSTLGKVVRCVIRDTDVVGRYGGDEFIVILPHTTTDGAVLVGTRIVDLLDHQTIKVPGNGIIPIRSSVGVSMLSAHTFSQSDVPKIIPSAYFLKTAEALITQADRALYQAKREGGQRVCQGSLTEWMRFEELNAAADDEG
jgi:diguanylate cyclase (GGDEF)-like protein